MPVVSVIIAAYNHAAYVRAAVESVLSQSYQDFEILVTDDGSADGTPEVVEQIRDPRIKLTVLPQNSGACIAWNECISRATGKYVALLNSDDLFLPDKLAEQVSWLDRHPDVAAVFSYPTFIDERGDPVPPDQTFYGNVFFVQNRPRHAWLRHFFFEGNALCHPTSMVRRQCHKTVGAYNPALAQLHDLELYVRILGSHEIHVIERALTAFRILDNQRNASAPRGETFIRTHWELAAVLEQYRNLPVPLLKQVFPELADAQQSAVPGWLRRMASAALARGTPDLAFQHSELLPLFWRLGAISLSVPKPAHAAFALDLMYEAARESGNARLMREFIKLSGTVDLYGILRRTAQRHSADGNEIT